MAVILKALENSIPDTAKPLSNGGVAILPTDTLYGLVARAERKDGIEKVYRLKGRRPDKPSIILSSSIEDVERLGGVLSHRARLFASRVWPGPVTTVVPVQNASPELLPFQNTLAFRIPDNSFLLKLLALAGPLIAPSANKEGEPPAESAEEALKQFGEEVDVYVDGGVLKGEASTIVSLSGKDLEIIREGKYPKEELFEIWSECA